MTLKTVFAPHLDRHVKMGRMRSIANSPHFKLSRYLKALPPPPATLSLASNAMPALRDIMGNDDLGDCVIAAGYHFEGIATGNAGDLFHATSAEIIADYSAIGGYVPGDESTDNGCDMQTAANYWVQKGFRNGSKLLGWIAVDPTNKIELQMALWLFDSLFFGIELPDAWISPFPSGDGFTWDLAKPNPDNGHCIPGVGYNAKGVTIDSWGLFGALTWAAIASLCLPVNGGEVMILLTPDLIQKAQAKAPNGFDWATLIADFDALGGHVAIPPPVVVPPIVAPPAPSAKTLTLAQAQAALAAGWATK